MSKSAIEYGRWIEIQQTTTYLENCSPPRDILEFIDGPQMKKGVLRINVNRDLNRWRSSEKLIQAKIRLEYVHQKMCTWHFNQIHKHVVLKQ